MKRKDEDDKAYTHFAKIKDEYDRIAKNNEAIQSEFADVNKKMEVFCQASSSIRVIASAFEANPELKNLLWKTV